MCSQDVSDQKQTNKKSPPQAAFKNVLADAEWNGKKKNKKGGGRCLHRIRMKVTSIAGSHFVSKFLC